MKTYDYGMRLRGFSPACQPMKGLLLVAEDKTKKYHDVLTYARKLSDAEVADYELDFLGEGELKL